MLLIRGRDEYVEMLSEPEFTFTVMPLDVPHAPGCSGTNGKRDLSYKDGQKVNELTCTECGGRVTVWTPERPTQPPTER